MQPNLPAKGQAIVVLRLRPSKLFAAGAPRATPAHRPRTSHTHSTMGRKGGHAHEQSLRDVKDLEGLPFYQPATDAAQAETRKAEVLEALESQHKTLGRTSSR
jgi:hypothetical protein